MDPLTVLLPLSRECANPNEMTNEFFVIPEILMSALFISKYSEFYNIENL